MLSSDRQKRAAKKLLQAAALASALVPLSTVRADASTISSDCFYNTSGAACGARGPHDGGMYRFGSDPYAIELKFDEVTSSGVVTIDASTASAESLSSRFSSEFEDFAPVPICPGCDEEFIDFKISVDDTFTFASEGGRGPGGTIKGWYLYIYWLEDTNAGYPDPRILHATGDSTIFDRDESFEYSPVLDPDTTCFIFDVCGGGDFEILGDPGAGGRDNMFSEVTLAAAPTAVPEPASLLLLGSGISAIAYRRRRRNAKSE